MNYNPNPSYVDTNHNADEVENPANKAAWSPEEDVILI
jgi:hypothetical protein